MGKSLNYLIIVIASVNFGVMTFKNFRKGILKIKMRNKIKLLKERAKSIEQHGEYLTSDEVLVKQKKEWSYKLKSLEK